MALVETVQSTIIAPATLPVWISRATVTLRYTPQAVTNGDADERAETLAEIVPHLRTIFSGGFLARPVGVIQPMEVSSDLVSADHLVLEIQGAFHVNAVTVLARLMANLHEVPGNPDTTVGLPPLRFAETVRSLQIDCAAATGSPSDIRAEVLEYIQDDPLTFPKMNASTSAAIQPVVNEERLVIGNIHDLPEDIEEAFLTLCGSGCFLPIGAVPDHEPDDAELFVHEGALVIDRLPIETGFLVEFIGLLTAGWPDQTTVILPV